VDKMRKNIFDKIRTKILHLKIMPGEPLNEEKLAKELQVSRTPIREALHRLSSEGLVTITPNLGARVSEINIQDFRELIEFRIILERGAGQLVAKNSTEEHIRAMMQLHDTIQSEKTENLDRLTDFDLEFHSIIRKAAHNQLLEKQMEIIQIRFIWLMRFSNYIPKLMIVKIPDFIESMKQRDAENIECMLVEHVESFVESFM
jgi:DNA-binding GntR family transcriptional regulator